MRLGALSAALCGLLGCGSGGLLDTAGGHPDAGSSSDAASHSIDTAIDATDEASSDEDAGTGVASDIGTPLVLATGLASPSGIAVDATNVYWLTLGIYHPSGLGAKVPGSRTGAQVMKCAKAGCGNHPTVLATGDWRIGGTPAAIAVDGSDVYWGADGQVLKCATSGCGGTPTAILSGTDFAYGIALDATNVYVTTGGGVQVLKCAKSGCGSNPVLLWSGEQQTPQYFPQGIVIDGATAYWTIGGGLVMRCATAGCGNMPEHFWTASRGTSQAATNGIAVDGTHVYWTNSQPLMYGQAMQCARSNCAGTVKILASGLSLAYAIAVDGANAYFTQVGSTLIDGGGVYDGPGRVMRCAIGGCGGHPTALADGLSGPLGIALDANAVYWTEEGMADTDGEIVSLPK